MYAMGILGDGERKSVEPMAARACAGERTAEAAHQSLLHFIANARWSKKQLLALIDALLERDSLAKKAG